MTKTKKKPTPRVQTNVVLGADTDRMLRELADQLHGGIIVPTLREIIRKAHREEFGSAKPQH